MDVEKVVREYIDKTLHMSLATVNGDKPWVCEVHFVYDDNLNLYWRSLATRRHSQELMTNPNVAGNIVEQHALGVAPTAIYFEGKAQLVDDAAEREKLFPLFQKRLNADEGILEEAKTADGHQFYKISVENWYAFGKFGAPRGQKLELKWNGSQKA